MDPKCCDQCDQIWQNFATLDKISKIFDHFLSVYLEITKVLNLLWNILMLLGKIVLL